MVEDALALLLSSRKGSSGVSPFPEDCQTKLANRQLMWLGI